jgi:hypothetical protein
MIGASTGTGKASMPFKIKVALPINQPMCGQEIQHLRTLIVVMLQQQPPTWCQSSRGVLDEAADAGQSVVASIQGQARFMISHNHIEVIHFVGWDVGRIGQDELQTSPPGLKGSKPISLDQIHPIGETSPLQIETRLS